MFVLYPPPPDATPDSETDTTPDSETDATPDSETDATPDSETDTTPDSEADAVAVAEEADAALVVDHRGDAGVALDDDGALDDGDLLARPLGLVAPAEGLDEGLEQVVHVVGDRLVLPGVVDERVVAERGVGDVRRERVPLLAERQLLAPVPPQLHPPVFTLPGK